MQQLLCASVVQKRLKRFSWNKSCIIAAAKFMIHWKAEGHVWFAWSAQKAAVMNNAVRHEDTSVGWNLNKDADTSIHITHVN